MPIAVELRSAARPLGKDQKQAFILEQSLRVLRKASKLPHAAGPGSDNGIRAKNLSVIVCASRGGFISSRHAAMTMAASMAMPPE